MAEDGGIPRGSVVIERWQSAATVVCAVVAVLGLPATLYSAYAAYKVVHPATIYTKVPVVSGESPAMVNPTLFNYSFLTLSILGALATLLAIAALAYFTWKHFHKKPGYAGTIAFFTPLQMEAFQLARELRLFLYGLGNSPDDVNSRELWLSKLIHTYALKYAPKVKILMHRFGIKDVFDLRLQFFIETVNTEVDISYVANALTEMACRIEFIYLMDGEAKIEEG
jgi:hypothetical protein